MTRIIVLSIVLLSLVRACDHQKQENSGTAKQTATQESTEIEILEVVFQYQIEHCYTDRKPELYFLSYQERDPPEGVVKKVRATNAIVSARSQMQTFRDKNTGQPGILLAVQKIDIVTDTAAEARGSCGAALMDGSSYIFSLVLQNGNWVVKNSKRSGVS